MDLFNRLKAIKFLISNGLSFRKVRHMRRILILNPKGGCGKSTIATSLAGYFASNGHKVALADYDPQGSSISWLANRPEKKPKIYSIKGYESGLKNIPSDVTHLVMDAPARSEGQELDNLIRISESIVFPVLPSPIDMEAAVDYLDLILNQRQLVMKQAKMALVANRIKENTLSFDILDDFLEKQKIPYVATLRESQNYIKCFDRGLGIHELAPYLAYTDWEQWQPLINWIDSKKSLPE